MHTQKRTLPVQTQKVLMKMPKRLKVNKMEPPKAILETHSARQAPKGKAKGKANEKAKDQAKENVQKEAEDMATKDMAQDQEPQRAPQGKEQERTNRGKATKESLSIQDCGTSATRRRYKKVKVKKRPRWLPRSMRGGSWHA